MEEQYPKKENQDEDPSMKKDTERSKDEEKFEREFYEPATVSTTTNIVSWIIAAVLFVLAVWLLWVALR